MDTTLHTAILRKAERDSLEEIRGVGKRDLCTLSFFEQFAKLGYPMRVMERYLEYWVRNVKEVSPTRKPYSIWAAREALHCFVPPGPVTVSDVARFMSDKFREQGFLLRLEVAMTILSKFGEGWVYPTQFKGLSIHPLVRREFRKLNPGVVFDSDRQQWRERGRWSLNYNDNRTYNQ